MKILQITTAQRFCFAEYRDDTEDREVRVQVWALVELPDVVLGGPETQIVGMVRKPGQFALVPAQELYSGFKGYNFQ